MKFLDSQGNGGNLLHEFGANLVGNCAAARAGHEHSSIVPINSNLEFHAFEEFQRLFGLLGLVALIVLPQNLVGRLVDHNSFDRG